jgi:uncharacterized protein (TIGR04551 family)
MHVFRLDGLLAGWLILSLVPTQLLAEEAKSASAPETATPLPPLDKTQQEGLTPPPPGFTEVTIDQSAAAKAPLNLVDLHGYLRLRGDLDKGVDLGTPMREPYPQFPHPASGRNNTISTANMRFRLEPTLNISEDVRIMGQLDVLDNLVLGSTPDNNGEVSFLSQSQSPPRTSLAVKRLWGEVKTPIGLIRAGRMGSQWGLGVMANDGGPSFVDRGPLVTSTDRFDPVGRCFDCDYGSTVDRFMFITKFLGHYFVPFIDFTSEGPAYANFNDYGTQSIDLDQLDDVHSYGISIFKRDKPEDIREAILQDSWVLNYGVYFTYRNQSYSVPKVPKGVDTNTPSSGIDGVTPTVSYTYRGANMFMPDIWIRFMWRKLRIELEAVLVAGKLTVGHQDSDMLAENKKLDMLQAGGVLQVDYRLVNDQLLLGFEAGVASGDEQLAFGSTPFLDRQLTDPSDLTKKVPFSHVNNYIFNRDYHVDLILWREIVGAVTNAYYLKPSAQYTFPAGIGAKLSAIYSSSLTTTTRGQKLPLGLEFDIDAFYFSNEHFHAGVSYGLLIPLAGMNDLGNDLKKGVTGSDLEGAKDKSASIAHRVMGRLVLYF